MRYVVEFDREEDGRWIADVPTLPGVMAYGQTREEALAKVATLGFRVLLLDAIARWWAPGLK